MRGVGYNLDENIRERLKFLRGDRTQEEFALLFGMNRGTYASLENNGKTISFKLLNDIAKHENIDLNWLITGSGSQSISSTKSISSTPSTNSYKAIPIVGEVAAGTPTIIYSDIEEAADVAQTIDEFFYHAIKYSHSNQVVFVRVNGDSMEPLFLDQDLLLIERDVPFNALRRGVFGIFSLDGEFTFKRLNIQSNNLILLEPLNSKYSTIAANPATLRIYGIAIAIFRSLKEGMLCL